MPTWKCNFGEKWIIRLVPVASPLLVSGKMWQRTNSRLSINSPQLSVAHQHHISDNKNRVTFFSTKREKIMVGWASDYQFYVLTTLGKEGIKGVNILFGPPLPTTWQKVSWWIDYNGYGWKKGLMVSHWMTHIYPQSWDAIYCCYELKFTNSQI